MTNKHHFRGSDMTSDPDETGDRSAAKRRSHRAEAIKRVSAALASLGIRSTATAVIEAPETGIYVQFMLVPDGFVAEAVGESNLPKLSAHHMGPAMRAKLPELGWIPPTDPSIDHGNWTRTWPSSAWDPDSVARLVVRTFDEVFGLQPWALAVSLARE